MKQTILFILILLGLNCPAVFASPIPQNDTALQRLFELSAKNLNYSSLISEDSIIQYCIDIETRAREEKDYETYFKARQIEINAHCLKGDIGVAIDNARQMYEDARAQQHELGTVLALQAIGDTYMHSNRFKQADETFTEANRQMNITGDNITRMRLLIQHIHTCLNMKNAVRMYHYLTEAYQLLPQIHTSNKNDYIFQLSYYEGCYHVILQDSTQAKQSLDKVLDMKNPEGFFDRWKYDLSARYFGLIKNYPQALAYSDSTLQAVQQGGNINEYKNSMADKAALLKTIGMDKEACLLYEEVNTLTDSLNVVRYADQINSLRVTYLVDQLQLENANDLNKLLTRTILYSIAILLMLVVFIQIIKRRNRQLKDSHNQLTEASKKAVNSIQSKSMFLSNMSHEIRTPLNAIVGFSEILTTCDTIDAETKEQCGENIRQNSDLLLKLINDVMDLSSLEENNMTFTFERCDVIALCHNVIDTVNKVKRTTARVEFITTLEKLELDTDTGRLQQVLINLLINATKFTSEGYITLRLVLNEQKDEAIFSVEDTGCGIPPEQQASIFKRFEKLHEGIQGSGLGLSICQLIVQNMGGEIGIDSKYTQGAKFVFTHPLKRNEPKEQCV